MRRANSLENTLILGKIEREGEGGDRMRWLNGITDSVDMGLSKLQEIVKERESGALHSMDRKKSDKIEQLENNKTIFRFLNFWPTF